MNMRMSVQQVARGRERHDCTRDDVAPPERRAQPPLEGLPGAGAQLAQDGAIPEEDRPQHLGDDPLRPGPEEGRPLHRRRSVDVPDPIDGVSTAVPGVGETLRGPVRLLRSRRHGRNVSHDCRSGGITRRTQVSLQGSIFIKTRMV